MARNLRRFGEGMVKFVAIPIIAASLFFGGASHIGSLKHEREMSKITHKSFAEYDKREDKILEEDQGYLQNCETGLAIGAYGAVSSAGIAFAGGALCLADAYRRKRQQV